MLLSQARYILVHAPDLVKVVMDGGASIQPLKLPVWLIGRECGKPYGDPTGCTEPPQPPADTHESSGDQAGSEAKLGVGSLSSLRPAMSMV